MSIYRSPRDLWTRFINSVDSFTTGGSWSAELAESTRYNLRWFFYDGTFASASDAITATYITLYVLALGANSAEIGYMTALASLAASFLLMPGAMVTERLGKRKLVTLFSGGGVTRLMFLLMALMPLVVHGSAVVYVAITLKVIADGFANLSLPAWTSLAADIVPLKWRGRYFGTRNMIMGITNMASTLLVGFLITQIHSPVGGYQVALALAFVLGAVSTFCFAHLREPVTSTPAPAQISRKAYTPASLWHTLKTDRVFAAFCAQALVWNFALNVAGPFFNVHLVQNLGASAAMVGIVSIVSSITGLPGQRLFGHLADKWGPRKVQLVTGLLIPILPFSWAIVNAPWQVGLINVLGGFLWAGYNIASFNFLLVLSPPEQRERYTALFQVVVMAATAIGAAVGGMVVTHFGFIAVFLISGAIRVLAMLIFIRFVRQDKPDRSKNTASEPVTPAG